MSSRDNDGDKLMPPLLPRLISGSVGAIVTSLAVTPLEVVKVRQQTSGGGAVGLPPNVTPCRGCGTFILNNGLMECVLPKSAVPYFDPQSGKPRNNSALFPPRNGSASPKTTSRRSGTFKVLRQIFRTEGIRGVYAGLAPTLVMSVPNTVLYFTAYDEIVALLRSFHKNKCDLYTTYIVPLAGGGSARFLASAATAPLELIRTRQAAIVGNGDISTPGLVQEFRNIIRSDGVLSLYRGLGPTLWRDVPFSAIYWLCLERFKHFLKREEKHLFPKQYIDSPLAAAGTAFISGAGAGLIAAAATTPFDVVKTRRQTIMLSSSQVITEVSCNHRGAVAYRPPIRPSGSTFEHMTHIVQDEGVRGLWRGNAARMFKVAPACAIMISCYELGKHILEF